MQQNHSRPSNVEPTTSPSLLMRIRNPDDAESWNLFEAVYAPIVRNYCERRGIQLSDIDDITQEVMTAVARNIQRFDYQPQRGRFRAWFATITANKLKNFLASQSKYKRHTELSAIAEQLATEPLADTHWSAIFSQRLFDIACQRIQMNVESLTWECFRATWLENTKATLVAKNLGIPIQTVYVNKSRVLKKLEDEFLNLSEDCPIVDATSKQ